MEKKRLIIIDSNSVIHRAFHALPPLTTQKGEVVGAVYGFLLFFLKAIKEFQPNFIVACFDFPAPTFRHKKYKEYKAKRPPAPKELYSQIPKIKELLKKFNIMIFEKEGFEADDLIGTISRLAPKKQAVPEIETIILSGDSDVLQLVDKNTKAYNLRRGVKDAFLYDEKEVQKKYDILPSQLLEFKALRGDPSDNIPGVTGVGEKTAIKLVKHFGSLENLYEKIQNSKFDFDKTSGFQVPEKLKIKLLDYKEQAFFSKDLVKIKRNAEIDFKLEKCRWDGYEKEKVIRFLKDLEFYSLISKLPENKSFEKTKPSVENLKLW